LQTKISLKSEEKLMDSMQNYEALCLVASAAFGKKEEELAPAPDTAEQLDAILQRHMG
jgi:hypothetical protein